MQRGGQRTDSPELWPGFSDRGAALVPEWPPPHRGPLVGPTHILLHPVKEGKPHLQALQADGMPWLG